MATNTYVALDKVTVGTATPSVTFSSIPSTYTDLIVVVDATNSAGAGSNGWGTRLRFNGDTASNYSWTIVNGNGTTASSARGTSVTSVLAGWSNGGTSSSTQIIHVMNYANTTTYKTTIGRSANAVERTAGLVNLWRKTPEAITSITIFDEGSNNWQTGSTFSLYGVKSEGAAAKATGGYITSDSTYIYHTFPASGTFTPLQSLTADCLVVAGGAGGGRSGGGGGAGGLLAFTSQSLTATGYTVTVGSGGAGNNVDGQTGTLGGDSQFGALTLVKGGGGGGSYGANGATGGSGGGGGGFEGAARTGGSATSGQGNTGGNGFAGSSSLNRAGGGGGGAGAVGAAATSAVGGNGGVGSSTYSSWAGATGVGQNVSGTYYLAGGGGGYAATGGTGGLGGGGGKGVNGTANTGGGGGGSASDGTVGFNGGSGVVIIRYAK